MTGPVARNPAVRRALARRVETRDLVWRTLGRLAQPAISLIPPGMLGHDPGKRSHALNREEALALLRAAGFEPPVRLKASVHPLLQDSYGALLTALFALWSEVGVEVSLATSEMASYREAWAGRKELDLLIGRWNADYDSIYHQIEETLVREARVLPLFHEQAYRFARPEVEGLTVSFWSPIVAYENLHIRA